MERLRSSKQEYFSFQKGFSLKELLNSASRDSMGRPRRIKTIRWLAENIETVDFWKNLHQHLLEDATFRHSLGGIFSRESGQKQIENDTWSHAYSSLDNFLKGFDLRAIEFLFRDFQPQNNNPELLNNIQKARKLALEKFPRLRRLYWNDYQEILESVSFWTGINADLKKLSRPTTTTNFFKQEKTIFTKKLKRKNSFTILENNMISRFFNQEGQIGKRAQIPDYYNLSQIVKDTFGKDIRTFLLQYQSKSVIPYVKQIISETQNLIEQKYCLQNRTKRN